MRVGEYLLATTSTPFMNQLQHYLTVPRDEQNKQHAMRVINTRIEFNESERTAFKSLYHWPAQPTHIYRYVRHRKPWLSV